MFIRKILVRLRCPQYSNLKLFKRRSTDFHLFSLTGKSIMYGSTGRQLFKHVNIRKSPFVKNNIQLPRTRTVMFATPSDTKCWNCQEMLNSKKIYCASCGTLQYPSKNMNYFELFGVSQTFDVNLEDLSKKFKEMQMTFHPDKFTNKSKVEMEISEMYSRLLNQAYTTLKEPLKRGFYLLELKELPNENNFLIAQDFLTSVLEKNEELDDINTELNLERFMKTNDVEIKKHINLVSESFYCNNWKEARINLLKLNYFINLEQKIKRKATDFLSENKR